MEGKFVFKYGKDIIHTEKGKIMILEKDISSTYKKIGNDKGKLLIMFIPSGFENFFDDMDLSDTRPQETKKRGSHIITFVRKEIWW